MLGSRDARVDDRRARVLCTSWSRPPARPPSTFALEPVWAEVRRGPSRTSICTCAGTSSAVLPEHDRPAGTGDRDRVDHVVRRRGRPCSPVLPRQPAGHGRACADVPDLYRPQLVGTPPPGPTPPFSSVVITAASAQINTSPLSVTCQPARTDVWTAAPASPLARPAITGARIVLAAGDACSGPTAQPYPWPETATAPPAYDYRSVLMWAMGRALGLPDEPASPSVRRLRRPGRYPAT